VQVLMNELVRPEAPITDYVTRYSGITAAMMADVTTSLADVQVVPGATRPVFSCYAYCIMNSPVCKAA